MTDRANATTDVASHKADAPHHLQSLTYTDAQGNTFTSEQSKEKLSKASTAMVRAGVIPPLNVSDHKAPSTPAPKPQGFFGAIESGATNFWNAAAKDTQVAADVTKDLAIGAYHEATEHPGQLLESGAKGLGTALLATAAVAGAAALAPEAGLAATAILGVGAAIGITYEGIQFAKHLGGWSQDAETISNPECFSSNAVAAAHADLQGVGRESALIGTGIMGAMIAAPMAAMEVGDAVEGTAANRALASAASKQSSVLDIMKGAVTSGRYAPQIINGVTVLMPR
jgi:hypothetical protein